MTKEGAEIVMGLLDNAMSEMAASDASQKAFDYLSRAMSIVERAYYYGGKEERNERQMELDFNEPDYSKIPQADDE